MVTSVALGLIMSFEPHELDVMLRPPRAVDRPLLTPFALWRILMVSLALMAFTLVAFFWMKSQDVSDALARTVAVNALVIGQAFYALNSRYLLDSSVSIQAHRGNPYLPYSYGLLVVLQLLFTYAPPLQVLFDTEAVPLWVWPLLVIGGLIFFFLVEGEKLIVRTMRAGRDVQATAGV
jgi:magnesium-transporting ATPase (P-type)